MKDEKFMQLALKLAEKGRGRTSPNPMVGAVVVKKNRILAQGYHHKFGGPHAEAIALKACGDQAKDTTLYINLEPCCHFGKTPPCTDLIIQSGIKKVVCATIDPNPQVNGKGIKRLKKEGIQISLGVLQHEAKKLNEAYFKYITTDFPYVVLKVTQTLDGRIICPTKSSGVRWRRIFSELIQSKKLWTDAVLCDVNATDSMATFLGSANSIRLKVLLCGTWREITRRLNRLKRDLHKNIICVPTDHESLKGGLKAWDIKTRKNGGIDLVSLLRKAKEEGITSLLVEGGNQIATSWLKQKLVDKIWYFILPEISRKGEEPFDHLGIRKMSDTIDLKDCEFMQSKEGILIVGYPY